MSLTDQFFSMVSSLLQTVFSASPALLGVTALYLWDLHKHEAKTFKLRQFGILLGVAFFIGYLADQFLSHSIPGRGGIISVCGFGSPFLLEYIKTSIVPKLKSVMPW